MQSAAEFLDSAADFLFSVRFLKIFQPIVEMKRSRYNETCKSKTERNYYGNKGTIYENRTAPWRRRNPKIK